MLLRNMDICENTYAPPWSTAACLLLRGSESMTDSGLRPQEGITASSKPPHMNRVNPPMLRQRHISGSGWQESFQERAARRRGMGSTLPRWCPQGPMRAAPRGQRSSLTLQNRALPCAAEFASRSIYKCPRMVLVGMCRDTVKLDRIAIHGALIVPQLI